METILNIIEISMASLRKASPVDGELASHLLEAEKALNLAQARIKFLTE